MTRFGYVMVAYFATMGTIATAFIHPAPRVIWNASASVPIGFYSVSRATPPQVGDLVLVVPPAPLGRYMAERHYLPLGVPMLKHVAALAGQQICRDGTRITIDGTHVGDARTRDRHDRGLPVWRGCRTLATDEVFLMNPDVPDSLDGRYFGPLPQATVTGVLTPLWIPSPDRGAAPAGRPAPDPSRM